MFLVLPSFATTCPYPPKVLFVAALRVKRTTTDLFFVFVFLRFFPPPPLLSTNQRQLTNIDLTHIKMGKGICHTDGRVKRSRKPHIESSQSRTRRNTSRLPKASKILPLGALLLFLLLWIILGTVTHWIQDNGVGFSHHVAPFVDWEQRREAIRNAFVTSWDAYSQHAWGRLSEPSARKILKFGGL